MSDDETLVSHTVPVKIEVHQNSHMVRSWTDVATRGRTVEDFVKAEILAKIAADGCVTVDDLEVTWTCNVTVHTAKVPNEAYLSIAGGGESPELIVDEVNRRVEHFAQQVRNAWAHGVGAVSFDVMQFDQINAPTAQVVRNLLSMVVDEIPGKKMPTGGTILMWDAATRREVAEWAGAIHLVASDNDGVEIPPVPSVLEA